MLAMGVAVGVDIIVVAYVADFRYVLIRVQSSICRSKLWLEERFPFPVATTIAAVIWCVWHFPIWLQPSSNHYGDSIVGFAINIFVWAFVAAAIYKSTKSVLACAIYHSFINSIGAIYDWNKLFDAYPKSNAAYIYFGAIFIIAVIIWYKEEKVKKLS